jgi:hypothetical protein
LCSASKTAGGVGAEEELLFLGEGLGAEVEGGAGFASAARQSKTRSRRALNVIITLTDERRLEREFEEAGGSTWGREGCWWWGEWW